MKKTALILALMPLASQARADAPKIEAVEAVKSGMDWRFSVTIRHEDTGWEHYADGWEILDADGNVLGYRKLLHPHVSEQPFTRSLSAVVIPDGVREVFVRARCSETGWSDETVAVQLSPGG
jgi:hypothetical protein